MADIPNAGNYRDRLPPQRPPRRNRRSRHQPDYRHRQHQQQGLSPQMQRILFGFGATLVIYLLWGGWGIFFALLLLAGILYARHALHL